MTPIILVCGPSGSGKTSLVDHVLDQEFATIRRIRSVTTRYPRSDKMEQDAETYSFYTREQFEENLDDMIEWDEFCGNYYGTPRTEFDTERYGEADALIKVATVPGIAGFRKWAAPMFGDIPKHQVFTILIDADVVALASRLGGRGDEADVLRQRIASSMEERKAYEEVHWDVTIDTSYMSLPEASLMFESSILGILSICLERNKKWELS